MINYKQIWASVLDDVRDNARIWAVRGMNDLRTLKIQRWHQLYVKSPSIWLDDGYIIRPR
jgi:hypothetical protein